MPLERIAQELEHGLNFLTTRNTRDLPQRHRSMTAALDHSWRLLSERVASRAAPPLEIRGGFTADATQAVAEATPTDLEALADASWLRLTSDGRYVLHELTRHGTAKRNSLMNERSTPTGAQNRHATATLLTIGPCWNSVRQRFYRRRRVVAETAQEMENLLAAWDWMLARAMIWMASGR